MVIKHCFTGQALAATLVPKPTEHGGELAVCTHTFTETGCRHQLVQETGGLPRSNYGVNSPALENLWEVTMA